MFHLDEYMDLPETHPANWKAAEFRNDGKLNVADLRLMKQALLAQPEPDYVEPEMRLPRRDEVPQRMAADGIAELVHPHGGIDEIIEVPEFADGGGFKELVVLEAGAPARLGAGDHEHRPFQHREHVSVQTHQRFTCAPADVVQLPEHVPVGGGF